MNLALADDLEMEFTAWVDARKSADIIYRMWRISLLWRQIVGHSKNM